MASSLPTQVDYTSRDYEALRQDLIARVLERVPEWSPDDAADFGVVLIEAFAYMGDVMSYYIDRVANESAMSTAARRQSVIALARGLGYEPFGCTSSQVTVQFTNAGEDTLVLPAATVVTANLTYGDAVVAVPFETTESVTVPANDIATVQAVQGTVVNGADGYGVSLGISNGNASQIFAIFSSRIVTQDVSVYLYDGVNYVPWTRVDYLSDYSPLDKVYTVYFDGSGAYRIKFGDGVSGLIPTQGHVVYVKYRPVAGAVGNVPAGSITEITQIPGVADTELAALSPVTLSVFNDSAATGGSDEQSTSSIRTSAPQFYRSANRAVTREDFQSIALGVSGCGKASATSDGTASVLVAVAPYRSQYTTEERPGFSWDGEVWTTTVGQDSLRTQVTSALNKASLLGTQFSVIDPVYVPVVIELNVQVLDTIKQANAKTVIIEELVRRFDYAAMSFGASIYSSDIVSLVSALGVATEVSVEILKKEDDEDGTGPIVAEFDEILRVLEAAITVNLTGGVEEFLL